MWRSLVMVMTVGAGCGTPASFQSVFPLEEWEALAPIHTDDTNITILLLGDHGCEGGAACSGGEGDLLTVAESARELCQREGCDLGILLGGQFLPGAVHGNTSVDDVKHKRWETSFQEPLGGFLATEDFKFWAVFGEDDYAHGNRLQTQVQYSIADAQNSGGLWLLPDRTYRLPRLPEWLHIEMVDSQVMTCGWDAGAGVDQLAVVGEAFAESESIWKIAVGHHPGLSIGAHRQRAIDKRKGGKVKGDLDEARDACRMRTAGRVWAESGMNIMVSAHERDQQLLYGLGWMQVISGTASMAVDDIDDEALKQEGVGFGATGRGFAILSLTATHATVEFYDHLGNSLGEVSHAPEDFEDIPQYKDDLECTEIGSDCPT
jgi:hypothetical protein